jgi:hypothetical protein
MKFVTLLNNLQSKNQSINNTITVCVRSNVHQLIKVGRIYPAQYRTLQHITAQYSTLQHITRTEDLSLQLIFHRIQVINCD